MRQQCLGGSSRHRTPDGTRNDGIEDETGGALSEGCKRRLSDDRPSQPSAVGRSQRHMRTPASAVPKGATSGPAWLRC